MKKTLILLLFAVPLSMLAQNPDSKKAAQEAISELSAMLGNWHEESWHITLTGEKTDRAEIEYNVTTKLNGSLIMIETKGTDPKYGPIEFISIISYNVSEKSYKMHGFQVGSDLAYYFKVLIPNKKVEYGYEVENQGEVRITLTISEDGKTATQIGEYSTDGQNWIKFREGKMTKI